jgi:hypothetical protein
MKPAVYESHKVVCIDCDDTLILWDKSKYPHLPTVELWYAGFHSRVVIHERNRNLLIKLAKLGYMVVVWSMTGYDWAETVVKGLGLEQYVHLCMTKPRFYVDDKEADQWIGERVWREPREDYTSPIKD